MKEYQLPGCILRLVQQHRLILIRKLYDEFLREAEGEVWRTPTKLTFAMCDAISDLQSDGLIHWDDRVIKIL